MLNRAARPIEQLPLPYRSLACLFLACYTPVLIFGGVQARFESARPIRTVYAQACEGLPALVDEWPAARGKR